MSKRNINWEGFIKSSRALTGKYNKKMSGDMTMRLHDFYNWAKNYHPDALELANIDEVTYLRIGVNLLDKLVTQIDLEKEKFLDEWDKCKTGVKKCSDKTSMQIASLLRDYTVYTSILIGCVKKANGMILQRIRLYPKKFQREISDLEDHCQIVKYQIQENYGM